jgi:hypothetical protein
MTYTTYKSLESGTHYSEDDMRELFHEHLNECYGDTTEIAGHEYDTARALREVDPIAYRCALVDFIDSYDADEVQHKTLAEFLAVLD